MKEISNIYTYYCDKCEMVIDDYTKHCTECNRCTNRFDHHCVWLNNCIGARNYSYLVYSCISFTIFVGLYTSLLAQYYYDFHFIIYILVLNAIILTALLLLQLEHVYLWYRGLTCYDHILLRRAISQNPDWTSEEIET